MVAFDEHRASSSNSSSADENETGLLDGAELEPEPEEFPLQWHDDHWDELRDYESPYIFPADSMGPDPDWLTTHIERETSVANEDLYTNPTTQKWQEKLAKLSRTDLPTLQFPQFQFSKVKIPLFHDDETGDDYQIALHLPAGGFPDQLDHQLVYAFCPKDPQPFDDQVKPLVKILYHAPLSEKKLQQGVELPRYAIPLGTLTVRGTFRRRQANIVTDLRPNTEWTDYQVVLDAEREAMPLWILCSRRTLRDRRQAWNGTNINLPVFGGLMQFEEDGYDAACILDSVHRLGGEDRLNYRDACELVGSTRSLVDPVRSNATMEKFEALVGGSVPNTMG